MNYRRVLLSAYLMANMLCILASLFVSTPEVKAVGAKYYESCTKPDTTYDSCGPEGSLDCASDRTC
jgi:hypothetical protein